MCDAQQALFAAVESRRDADWIDLVEILQERVVTEMLGCGPQCPPDCARSRPSAGDVAAAVALLRTAVARWPDDAELPTLSVYRRFNRARRGSLRVGDPLPDCALLDCAGDGGGGGGDVGGGTVSLLQWRAAHVPASHPLLLVSGSWS